MNRVIHAWQQREQPSPADNGVSWWRQMKLSPRRPRLVCFCPIRCAFLFWSARSEALRQILIVSLGGFICTIKKTLDFEDMTQRRRRKRMKCYFTFHLEWGRTMGWLDRFLQLYSLFINIIFISQSALMLFLENSYFEFNVFVWKSLKHRCYLTQTVSSMLAFTLSFFSSIFSVFNYSYCKSTAAEFILSSSRRSIRCLRNIIHWNLITAFILRNATWFIVQLTMSPEVHESNVVCVSLCVKKASLFVEHNSTTRWFKVLYRDIKTEGIKSTI